MNKYQKINQFCSIFLKVNNIKDKAILNKFNKEKRDEISNYLNNENMQNKFTSYQNKLDEINFLYSLRNPDKYNQEYNKLINKIGNDLRLNPKKIEYLIYNVQEELIKLKTNQK